MATGQGQAIIDFGAYPGSNEASIVVTGQTSIGANSKVEAFVMADSSTADKTIFDHRYFSALVGLTCGTLVAGTGFTIFARSLEKLQGTFLLNFVWAD